MFAWSWVYRAFSPFHARETRNMEPIREFAELVLKTAIGGAPGDTGPSSGNNSGRDELAASVGGYGEVGREDAAANRGGCCGSSVELGISHGQGDDAVKGDGRDSGEGSGSQAAGPGESDYCGAAEGSGRGQGSGHEARVSVAGREGCGGGGTGETSVSRDCPRGEHARDTGGEREAEGGGGDGDGVKATATVERETRPDGGGGGGGGEASSADAKAEGRKGEFRTALSDMAGRESHRVYPGSMIDEVGGWKAWASKQCLVGGKWGVFVAPISAGVWYALLR